MKALVCEMCSSHDFIKDEEFFVCQSCGTKYTVEAAKKLMIEGKVDVSGSSVKIDQSGELNNLYTLARRARNSDVNSARIYYDKILLLEPNNWEPVFYSIYCKARAYANSQIQDAANLLGNSLESVLRIVKNNVSGRDLQLKAINEITNETIAFSCILIKAATDQFRYSMNQFTNKTPKQFVNACVANAVNNHRSPILLLYILGDLIDSLFDKQVLFRQNTLSAWKNGLNTHIQLMNQCKKELSKKEFEENQRTIQHYAAKIEEYDPSYALPEIKKSRFPFHL